MVRDVAQLCEDLWGDALEASEAQQVATRGPRPDGRAAEVLGALAALGGEERAVAVDAVIVRLGWSAGAVGAALLELELDGWVGRAPGAGRYRLA